MIVASGTGIEGCDPWQGTDSNETRISILEECETDPRSDWRGMITKFDDQGNKVWQRVDSFLSPEGEPTLSSACEYLSILADGKLFSVTDEAFGVGLLVLEPDSSSIEKAHADALKSSSLDLGNGWYELGWFGSFLSTNSGWKYHFGLGWMYGVPSSLDSIWLFDPVLKWCWTNASIFPYLWVSERQSWSFFQIKSKSRTFWHFTSGSWVVD